MQRVQDSRVSAGPYPTLSPTTAAAVRRHPPAGGLSQEWSLPAGHPDNLVACGVGLDAPPAWLDAGGQWCTLVADPLLGERERALWQASRKPEARRREWLLGRIAAKEATRAYVRRRHGLDPGAASFQILPDDTGRPVVTGLPEGICPPLVSISHADGAALAMAGDEALGGIGIDLERRGRMTQRMELLVFTPTERALLDVFDGVPRADWGGRLWCAKEAVAKFTGCTVVPTSRALTVACLDPGSGMVWLRYWGEQERRPGEGRQRESRQGVVTFRASTARHGEWLVATCVSASRAEAGGGFALEPDGVVGTEGGTR